MADDVKRIGELEDKLKAARRRIEELRTEIDEQRDLISRLREHAEDYDNVIESWSDSDVRQSAVGSPTLATLVTAAQPALIHCHR
jgi:chromosome segregation ATPase